MLIIDDDFKLRDNCHITGIYRYSAQRDCVINFKLDHRIPVVFHNPKNRTQSSFARTRQV